MTVQEEEEDRPRRRIKVPEVLNSVNRHGFRDELNAALAEGARVVELDFSATRSIDSAGLGLLVRMHRQMSSTGVRMVLCELNEEMSTFLQMTKLNTLFETEAPPEEPPDGGDDG